ncbi:MAG: V-type ATP synthase subunit E family protein [Halobacteria archaeon]
MGLEGVLKEIENRGDREVRSLRERAAREAEALLAEARAEAKRIVEAAEKQTAEEAARLRKAQIPAAELEARREMLRVEREILGTVLARTLEQLARLDAEKNRAWLSLLAKRALREGGQKLYGNPRDLATLKALGAVGGEAPCAGGVAAEAAGGAAWIDYTYDTLLEGVWRASLKEIHGALFPR